MQHQIRPAHAVRVDQSPRDPKARPFRIQVLAIAGMLAIRDDPLHFPLVRVEQKPHKRLLIIRVASRVRFNDQSQPLRRSQWRNNERKSDDEQADTLE